MTKLIALDDGHGMETAGKRTPFIPEIGRQIKENEFNREVVKYLDIELRRCGFKTLLTAPTDVDTPLAERVRKANNAKADLFISIHYNAYDGKFDGYDPEGFSAHVYLGNKNTKSGQFAKIALKYLAQGTKQKNRGLVEQNLYVTRETKMPAVLFELGFMDNKREALLMINKDFQKECAREIAQAVCEFYGVKYIPESSSQGSTTSSTHKATPSQTAPKHIGIATVKVAELNLRDKPNLNGKVLKVLKKGESYKVYGFEGEWLNLGGGYASNAGGKYMTYEPLEKAVHHTVQKGDTLWSISKEYGTTIDAIKKLNGLDSDVVYPNQKLRVK